MNRDEWKAIWKQEESHARSGWDFSHIQGRYIKGRLSWNYRTKVLEFLRPGIRVLEIGAGSGEFLLSLPHPGKLLSALVEEPSEYERCLHRLAPCGAAVERGACRKGEKLPFPDHSFDLVLNRGESYDGDEIHRVLSDGGFFITEQAGGQSSRPLAQALLPELERLGMDFNLENEAPKLRQAGFRLVSQNQAYPAARILDVGALCYYAAAKEREFPGFSVERCLEGLLKLQSKLEANGCLWNQEHFFFLIAKNRKHAD